MFVLELTPFIGFCCWLILAPRVFVKFYRWILGSYSSAATFPSDAVIRFLGVVWLLAILIFALYYRS
jgi:hypothetical protein